MGTCIKSVESVVHATDGRELGTLMLMTDVTRLSRRATRAHFCDIKEPLTFTLSIQNSAEVPSKVSREEWTEDTDVALIHFSDDRAHGTVVVFDENDNPIATARVAY